LTSFKIPATPTPSSRRAHALDKLTMTSVTWKPATPVGAWIYNFRWPVPVYLCLRLPACQKRHIIAPILRIIKYLERCLGFSTPGPATAALSNTSSSSLLAPRHGPRSATAETAAFVGASSAFPLLTEWHRNGRVPPSASQPRFPKAHFGSPKGIRRST
jgi:hypothetical protein